MNLIDAMRYLAALQQHRHFGRAAQACHITQPALSNAIRALESQYGVTIVRRSRQYEGLTPEGERVLASAHRLLHECEVLEQDLVSSRAAPRGRITIGAVPTAMPVAARFAARLQAEQPGLRPEVRSLSSTEIETGIESLSLDLAFGYAERGDRAGAPAARFEQIAQYTERYYLLQRRPAGAGQMPGRIGWAAAARRPLCLLSREMHHRSIVDAAFAQAGTEAEPVMETNSVLTLVLAVLAGEVCSVMPGALAALALQYPELCAAELIEPQVQVPMALLLPAGARLSLAQQAALALAHSPDWQAQLARHAGLLPETCCTASFKD
jgi:DNA-binding transcriptional LysR family regulator